MRKGALLELKCELKQRLVSFKLSLFVFFSVSVLGLANVRGGVLPSGEAPRGVPWPATWSSGNKTLFGTAFESRDSSGEYSVKSKLAPISKLWFTGAQGVVTELFWPTLDRKQIRDFQFLISDSKTFFFEERTQAISSTHWIEAGVPVFIVKNVDSRGRFEIEKKIYSDPDRDSLLVKVKFINLSSDTLSLYALVNPAIANTPYGDNGAANGEDLSFWQEQDAMVMRAEPPFRSLSVGFSGSEDPYHDLKKDFHFDRFYRTATDGNVVGMGALDEIRPGQEKQFEIAISFGENVDVARESAILSLAESDQALERFASQWRQSQNTLPQFESLSGISRELFLASVATLRSLEDKTFAGAFIASPSVPWGLQKNDNSDGYSPRRVEFGDLLPSRKLETQGIGAYHLVWPRDLYQMAQSFLAIGDRDSAKASLKYLKHLQFGPEHGIWDYGPRRFEKDGSFVQNAWLHGEAYWRMLQIDQVSYPIMLTYDLWRARAIELGDFSDMVFRAADFIDLNGPWSFQERWEENMGVTPSGVAAQMSALSKAVAMAKELGENQRAFRYQKKYNELDRNLENWTFTTSGLQGNGNYFLRIVGSSNIDAFWDPNSLSMIPITNGGERLLEKSVMDGGFLELVRHGIRSALNPSILETLPEYDASLGDSIRGAPAFRRYTGDRYNWDEDSKRQTNGMPWPFLTGERAIYELKAAMLSPNSFQLMKSQFMPFALAFESFASPSLQFPEQIWSSGPRQGTGTGAATPLGWAHGEYIQMLKEHNSFTQKLKGQDSFGTRAVQTRKASLQ